MRGASRCLASAPTESNGRNHPPAPEGFLQTGSQTTAAYLSRAVGNGIHFCDTTKKRLPKTTPPHIKRGSSQKYHSAWIKFLVIPAYEGTAPNSQPPGFEGSRRLPMPRARFRFDGPRLWSVKIPMVGVVLKMNQGQNAGLGNHVSTYQGNPFWNSGFLSHSHVGMCLCIKIGGLQTLISAFLFAGVPLNQPSSCSSERDRFGDMGYHTSRKPTILVAKPCMNRGANPSTLFFVGIQRLSWNSLYHQNMGTPCTPKKDRPK